MAHLNENEGWAAQAQVSKRWNPRVKENHEVLVACEEEDFMISLAKIKQGRMRNDEDGMK